MLCPNCGLNLEGVTSAACPRCGQPLLSGAPPTPYGMPQPPTGSPYLLGQPAAPLSGPAYPVPPSPYAPPGAPAAPSAPLYGQPGYEPPAMPPYGQSPYGQSPYSQPLPQYGQMQYGQPPYGTPAAPSVPMYAPGMPGAPGAPSGYPQPYAPLAPLPQRKRRTGRIIGIVALVIVVVVASCGALLYATSRLTPTASAPSNPTSSATSTPGENVIFHDALTPAQPGWASDSHCTPKSDGYHIKDGYICYAPTGDVGDGVISADVKQVSGEQSWFYGIVFRLRDGDNRYGFVITTDGSWKFDKFVNGKRTDLIPYVPNPAIHTGLNAVNMLKVRMQGSHFEFFINGTLVGQKDDATYTEGRCGIDGNQGIEVVYTNFDLATL